MGLPVIPVAALGLIVILVIRMVVHRGSRDCSCLLVASGQLFGMLKQL